MQKKLLALAVAGALVPAAAMAQSSVEIYGRANLSFGNWKADGATGTGTNYDARNRIVDSGSRLGFRVNESLGGGLRAFVVMETGVNIDSGSQAGQSGGTNGSTGFWASRDSYLGLGGSWGDVRLGRQSIWWSNGVIAQTGANYIDSAVDGLITGHMLAAPVTRQSSVISYNTPTFSGFNASFSYSPHTQEAGAFTEEGAPHTAGGTQEAGSIWGVTARYTSGALRGQFDYAVNKNVANQDGADNDGIKLGVGWAYAPGSQVSGIVGRLTNEEPGVEAEVTFWLLNWEHMIGQFQLLGQLYMADDVEFSPGGKLDNSGVTGITLAAKYFLSKRTGVYVSLNNVKNDENAFADLLGGGFSSAAGGRLTDASAGADVRSMAVGVIHNF